MKRKKIVLVGGGPGIHVNYLCEGMNFLKQDFELVEFQLLSDTSVEKWTPSLEDFIAQTKAYAVIGHSFGGMLLMNSSKVEEMVEKILLLSTFPLERAADVNASLPEINKTAFAEFLRNKTNETFKAAFLNSWAEVFFTPESLERGKNWLAKFDYDFQLYEMSLVWYKIAKTRMNIENLQKVFNVCGELDRRTPPWGFGHLKTNASVIPGAAHFPWVESEESTANLLSKILLHG